MNKMSKSYFFSTAAHRIYAQMRVFPFLLPPSTGLISFFPPLGLFSLVLFHSALNTKGNETQGSRCTPVARNSIPVSRTGELS